MIPNGSMLTTAPGTDKPYQIGFGVSYAGRSVSLTLPWPPSVNHYWRMWQGRMLISRAGRLYREQLAAILAGEHVQPLCGPLAISMELYPPDRHRRDIDNVQKALLDGLEHGGAFHDDSQIAYQCVRRGSVVKGGRVELFIGEMDV